MGVQAGGSAVSDLVGGHGMSRAHCWLKIDAFQEGGEERASPDIPTPGGVARNPPLWGHDMR